MCAVFSSDPGYRWHNRFGERGIVGFVKFIAGLAIGMAVGMVGVVVYAGPLDQPIIGLVLAAAIVASGAWFILEWIKVPAWLGYILGIAAATFFFLARTSMGDAVVVPDMWPTQVWLFLAPVSALLPAIGIARNADARRGPADRRY